MAIRSFITLGPSLFDFTWRKFEVVFTFMTKKFYKIDSKILINLNGMKKSQAYYNLM
jgi:hypothetical protein